MIRTGQTIENPLTGERVTFLRTATDTKGASVLIDVGVKPGGAVAAAHGHPAPDRALRGHRRHARVPPRPQEGHGEAR